MILHLNLGTHYLNVAQYPCRVHPTGFIDRVAPDVKHRFGGPNDPTDQGTGGHAYPQHEVVEGVFIDVVQLIVQFRSEIYQVTEVIVGILLRISRFLKGTFYSMLIVNGSIRGEK